MVTFTVQTRGYEMDATRTIPPVVLLRYMEHGRWEFIRKASTGFSQFINSLVVVSQSVHIFSHIKEYVDLEISVWVGRIGNTSLDICQLIVNSHDRTPVAMGRASLVNVDRNLRPLRIGEGAGAFVAAAPSAFDAALFPVVGTPAAPADAWSMTRRVTASELDLLRHVNHSRYVDYVEDARKLFRQEQLGETISGKTSDLHTELTQALTIEYKQEALHGQLLELKVWPSEQNSLYRSQICRDNGVLVNAVARVRAAL